MNNMPRLYHAFIAHDFPNDQEYCSLCIANSAKEAEKIAVKDCAILPEDKLEVSAYPITNVDGYDVVLFKQPTSPKRIDYLNRTLAMIGLETYQPFGIDDSEFPDHYYIDSFGDLYIVNKDSFGDEIHEYLTLGRVLTQYYDKIITYKDDIVV